MRFGALGTVEHGVLGLELSMGPRWTGCPAPRTRMCERVASLRSQLLPAKVLETATPENDHLLPAPDPVRPRARKSLPIASNRASSERASLDTGPRDALRQAR